MEKITPYQTIRHAFFETIRFFGINRRSLVVPIIPSVGLGIDWYQRGWGKMIEEWHILLTYTILPLAGFIIVLFLCNLWIAPFRLLADGIEAHLAGNSPAKVPEPKRAPKRVQDDWVHVSELKLWEAACIIKGLNPIWPIPSTSPTYPTLIAMEKAAKNGELETVEYFGGSPHATTITRETLIDYSQKVYGEVPELYTHGHLSLEDKRMK